MLGDFDKVRALITNMVAVPPLEWVHFARHLRLVRLKAGSYYFKAGDRTESIGLVVSGLVHSFYTDEEGKECTKNFAWEGKLISPYAAILEGSAANFSSQAIENCIIAEISYTDLQKLYSRNVCWERLGRKCAESLLITRERREYQMLMKGNYERYRNFYIEFSPIIDRIPQYLIASYLGINAVSLSRIRSRVGQRKSEKSQVY